MQDDLMAEMRRARVTNKELADAVKITHKTLWKEILPVVRNRHEGYGLLAEDFVALRGAADGVTSMMKDTLRALTVDDSAFHSAADGVYSAALDLAIAAVTMAVSAINVSFNMSQFTLEPTPMEELIGEGDGDGIDNLVHMPGSAGTAGAANE